MLSEGVFNADPEANAIGEHLSSVMLAKELPFSVLLVVPQWAPTTQLLLHGSGHGFCAASSCGSLSSPSLAHRGLK